VGISRCKGKGGRGYMSVCKRTAWPMALAKQDDLGSSRSWEDLGSVLPWPWTQGLTDPRAPSRRARSPPPLVMGICCWKPRHDDSQCEVGMEAAMPTWMWLESFYCSKRGDTMMIHDVAVRHTWDTDMAFKPRSSPRIHSRKVICIRNVRAINFNKPHVPSPPCLHHL